MTHGDGDYLLEEFHDAGIYLMCELEEQAHEEDRVRRAHAENEENWRKQEQLRAAFAHQGAAAAPITTTTAQRDPYTTEWAERSQYTSHLQALMSAQLGAQQAQRAGGGMLDGLLGGLWSSGAGTGLGIERMFGGLP